MIRRRQALERPEFAVAIARANAIGAMLGFATRGKLENLVVSAATLVS
ncbi:hypothetical protein [Bradyrhizobium glycinis]|nr:hypothetical protein [Bradyrhizobium glycinis]MBH5372241.1 hypothetical protein [Bradyrhizobium glycinis]